MDKSFIFIDETQINIQQNLNTRKLSKWVDDDSVTKCYNCNTLFSFFVRKHHCRLCGRVYCYYCSNYYIKLPTDIIDKLPDKNIDIKKLLWNTEDKVRVCSNCNTNTLKLLKIRKIIKVFEICNFDIRDLIILSKFSIEWKQASNFLLTKFKDLQYNLSIEIMKDNENKILWNNAKYLKGHDMWIAKLITINLKPKQENIIKNILNKQKINSCNDIFCSHICEKKTTIYNIIDFLMNNNNYVFLSSYIIEKLSLFNNKTLKNYIPFFVSKIETNWFLVDFLIMRSKNDFNFLSNFYWCVVSFNKKLEGLVISEFSKTLSQEFMKKFNNMCSMKVIDSGNLEYLNKRENIILPILSDIEFDKVDPQIKIMNSNSKPFIMKFIKKDGEIKEIMFKNDDIRKDNVIINLINIVQEILKNEGIDIEIVNYNVVPTGNKTGYIEIIPNAITIFDIVEVNKITIQNYILNNNKEQSIKTVREKFTKSTALYSMLCFLLSVGDRHLDNIMVTTDGLLCHIDYNYILGNDPKYIAKNKNLRINTEIINTMGDDYENFKKLCIDIYKILRLHVNLFSNLLSVLTETDKSITNEIIKNVLESRFEIGEDSNDIATHMNNIVKSQNNLDYILIDFFYKSKSTALYKNISGVTDTIMKFFT